MKIQYNGVSIRFQQRGSGEPAIIFLHYWGGSSSTWHHVTDVLSKRFRTIATDHRGWGSSDADDDEHSIDALAADAQGVIDALGLTRYIVVGHSMGGKVAQKLASRQPAGLVGMVLVAPASPSPSTIPEDQRASMSHAYDSRASILATCEHVLTGKALAGNDLERVVQDSLHGSPAAKVAWPMRMMMEDITDAVARIRVPVLIIAGELDKVDSVTQVKTEVLGRIQGATMQVLPGTGHLSPLESPTALAKAIADFAGEVKL